MNLLKIVLIFVLLYVLDDNDNIQDVMKSILHAALEISQMEAITGRKEPSVIT